MTESPPVLVRAAPGRPDAPALDPDQQAVVDHRGGPLLVLAGPGTGKTTTLVEAVVARVEEGLAPEQILVLTFSRKAAQELRRRITARLGVTTRGPTAMTFHSYAYALLRRETAGPPLRLLTGAEQDVEIRRLLEGEVEDGAQRWPTELRDALGLRGFRRELRDLLQRAQEHGLGGDGLTELGRRHGRPDWVAAGGFLDDYDARFDLDPTGAVIDQAALVAAAAGLLEADEQLRERERAEHPVVFVDEFQDTDPAQVRLLQVLAGDGRELVAVGDPDQSIYAFRGADVSGILGFREAFANTAGAPAEVVRLGTCRRSGSVLLAASRAVASRLPAGGLGPGFRDLSPDPAVVRDDGQVALHLASSPTAETAHIADVLRRAHLVDGVPWSQMAVLLRSTTRSLARVRRGLLTAGVPVVTPSEELPLSEEPLVRALLDVIRAAHRPERVDEQAALGLLTSPLVRADALVVRRLRRALRRLDETGGERSSSEDLLVGVLLRPGGDVGLDDRSLAVLVQRVRRLLAAATTAGSAEEVLWAVWEAAALAEELEADSRRGGARGAVADRSLDAVIGLFDTAARFTDRLPHLGVLDLADDVAAQEIPSDGLTQRTPEGDAVRVLTAHSAKGLEWRLVVVAGVQEGSWPDLRRRGSVLGADDLRDARGGVDLTLRSDRRPALLQEERRLFYVAVTRASERLLVTAVDGGEGADDRPSRLLAELGLPLPPVTATRGRPLTLTGLLADLRRTAAHSPDPALREAAARRLARLATGDGVPRVRAAHPDHWWGVQELSDDQPLVLEGEQLRVSPSKVESFDACSLRWFLTSAVGVSSDTGPAQVLGSLVHALCELSATEGLDLAALTERLDTVLPELDLGAPWAARANRRNALDWLGKFVRWAATNPRELVGTELDLQVPLGEHTMLTGRVDRLERDDQGRAYVVDLKTGSPAATRDVPEHPQLGVYQWAAEHGAFQEHGLTRSGGAALLNLKANNDAKVQDQPALSESSDPGWAASLLDRVVAGMSSAAFPPTAQEACRSCVVRSCCPLYPEGDGVVR